MNAFLLSFDSSTVSRQDLIAEVNRLDGVSNWLAFMPTALVLVSDCSARELTSALKNQRSQMRFLLTRCDPLGTDGQLPRQVWEFINRPEPLLETAVEGSARAKSPFAQSAA